MEPNCCIFPAPTNSKFGPNLVKILLVPYEEDQRCDYYHQRVLLKKETPFNEFLHFCSKRKSKYFGSSTATTKANSNSKFKEQQKKSREGNNYLVHSRLDQNKQYMSQAQILLSDRHQPHTIQKIQDAIPCLFLPGLKKDKIVVFFHGNGEDICSASQFGTFINAELERSVIIMEYRSYSVYGHSANSSDILKDGCRLIYFLLEHGFEEKDIILFGRSIGGAFAFEIASKFNVASLILLSPFLSLKKIAADLYGQGVGCLIKQSLDNHSIASSVKCPVLIIHGLKDTLVPFQHSVSILGQCKGYSRLKIVQNMTHIKFNFRYDFLNPLKQFLQDLKIIP